MPDNSFQRVPFNQKTAYSRNNPESSIFPSPIVVNRAPTTSDTNYALGQVWINNASSPKMSYEYLGGGTWETGGNADATTSEAGIVIISTDIATDYPTDDKVPTVSATKDYVDGLIVAGAPVATEVTQGIGELATDAEAIAGTASTALKALLVTPSNLSPVFASPPAIGGTSADAGTFTDLTADGTGTVSLGANAASDFTVTGAFDLTLASSAGSIVINPEEAADDALQLTSAAGGLSASFGLSAVIATTEANADSMQLTSAGGMDITATGAAGKDIDIVCTSGSVNITGGENVASSVVITNKGFQCNTTGAAGQDILLSNTGGSVQIVATEAVSDAINIDSSGGIDADAAGQINLTSSQNTADAIRFNASAGGIDIDAAGAAGEDIDIANAAGSINLTAGEAAANAIVITSTNGGMDLTAGGGAGLDTDITNTSGSVNITAGEAIATSMVLTSSAGGIDITAAGGAALDIDVTCTNGSVNITAGEAASDAFVLDASNAAGGVQIKAGTGGIAIGNEADTTPIGVGDIAPTASRTITVGGGTVVTAAVTDTIDIGPDGATTNADSVKTVNINTGGVTTGQVLTNIATGTITSGTHTVGIQTGNAAAGTVATNLSTGTGTKTVNVGNADGLTTLNLDTVTLIADSVNANTSINTGTSTGTVSIGNAAAGAITVDSGAGISLDAATASNFACAAGDLTVDATAGSLILSSGESAADSIQIISDNGGIDISAAGAAAGEDIDITATGSSINLTSTEAVSDAIVISASDAAGGIVLDAGSGKVSVTGASLALTTAATQLQVGGGAVTDFIGTATLVAGTVTVANTNIAATDRIFVQRNGVNASTTLGELDVSISAGASFTITSLITGTPGSTQTGDVSSVMYFIVRQL